jgi:hypothetical protein
MILSVPFWGAYFSPTNNTHSKAGVFFIAEKWE